MSMTAPSPTQPRSRTHAEPAVEIVVPVHNEARTLRASIHELHEFLHGECAFDFRITIADNASTDATPEIARELTQELEGVGLLRIERKGRGVALRRAWEASGADVLVYMDVDLSTDLAALPALVGPLLEGRGDLAIGTRLAPGAQVTRGLRRELISRCYNVLLRVLLDVSFSDAQCGFKAGRREVIQQLLPAVEDEQWFFDTELLYVAQRRHFSIREIPVRWVDDPDSSVAIVKTAREDLRGIARLRRRPAAAARRSRGHLRLLRRRPIA